MKARKLLINLSVFLLSGFIIIYIIIQLISGLTRDVSFEYATKQTVSDSLEKTGYLVRNEMVVYATDSGITTYSVGESQKVGNHQLIATVYSDMYGVNLENQIKKIDEKIQILERSSVETEHIITDIGKIDQKIHTALYDMQTEIYLNNLSLASRYKETLLINYNKRQLLTTSAQNFDEQIARLREQKAELTSSLSNPLCSVYSPKSGYFSTLLDGFETIYTPDSLKDLTVDKFHDMIHKENVSYGNLAVGKIISDFEWRVLCEVTAAEAADLKENNFYKVNFLYSSSESVKAKLEKIVRQTNTDSVVLVFFIEEVPQNFNYTRKQSIKIVKEEIEGISFSHSALRLLDGVPGVYVIDGNSVGFRRVDIIYRSNTLYYSNPNSENSQGKEKYLSQFDRVITEGKDLYVGKILN